MYKTCTQRKCSMKIVLNITDFWYKCCVTKKLNNCHYCFIVNVDLLSKFDDEKRSGNYFRRCVVYTVDLISVSILMNTNNAIVEQLVTNSA